MAGGGVLGESKAFAYRGAMGNGTDPVFLVQVFAEQMRGQKNVADGEEEIELAMLEEFGCGGLPGEEVEADAEAVGRQEVEEAGKYGSAGVVRAGEAEVAALVTRIEDGRSDEGFHCGQETLKLLKDVAASGRGFKTGGRADEEIVTEGGAGPLEGAADGWLRR